MIAMLEPRSYFELVEDYDRTTASLRSCAEPELPHVVRMLREVGAKLIGSPPRGRLEELAIWHADHLYRVLNRVDFLDRASFVFVQAVTGPLNEAMATAGLSIAYLVDNAIPHDRLVPAGRFFAAMGRVVASPELVAVELASADRIAVDDVCGPHLPRYLAEACAVTLELVRRTVEQRRSFALLSGNASLDLYHAVASKLDSGYVGVFRNQPPADGSTVQIFRRDGHAALVDPRH